MTDTSLDNPLILSILFHPRPARPGGARNPDISDGSINIEGDIALGYRLYARADAPAVIVYFHGNGEIAAEYDDIARMYHRAGASLMVVDYRGYGWSTGRPLVSALLGDTESVHAALGDILGASGLGGKPVVLMGRSLGSACAIHLADQHPQSFGGLIIESGFAQTIPLLARLGLPVGAPDKLSDPINSLEKMRAIRLPLLVIHGERDTLIPVEQGQMLYDASPAESKRILRLPGAGHNDLLYYADEYFEAIRAFLESVMPQAG